MLSTLFGGIWAKLLIAGAVALTILAVLFKFRSDGRVIERAKNYEQGQKIVKESRKVENVMRTKSDADTLKWMREHGYIRSN